MEEGQSLNIFPAKVQSEKGAESFTLRLLFFLLEKINATMALSKYSGS